MRPGTDFRKNSGDINRSRTRGALALGLEGIVAKDGQSPYIEGPRVTWQRQKIKNKDSKRAKGSREDAEKSDLTEEAIQHVNIRLHDLLDSTASKITSANIESHQNEVNPLAIKKAPAKPDSPADAIPCLSFLSFRARSLRLGVSGRR